MANRPFDNHKQCGVCARAASLRTLGRPASQDALLGVVDSTLAVVGTFNSKQMAHNSLDTAARTRDEGRGGSGACQSSRLAAAAGAVVQWLSMEVISLQSGSNGNCIYVEAGGVRLLFDAGISGRQAQQRLLKHGRDITQVDALLISHDHSDHSRCLGVFHRKFSLPVFVSPKTLAAATASHELGPLKAVHHFAPGQVLQFGDVRVETIRTPHDGADGAAFVVDDGQHRLGILTDLGHAFDGLHRILGSLDAVLLESNFDPEMLQHGPYPPFLQRRIRGPRGHLSNIEAAELLAAAAGERLQWACLAHLSEHNNHPGLALRHAPPYRGRPAGVAGCRPVRGDRRAARRAEVGTDPISVKWRRHTGTRTPSPASRRGAAAGTWHCQAADLQLAQSRGDEVADPHCIGRRTGYHGRAARELTTLGNRSDDHESHQVDLRFDTGCQLGRVPERLGRREVAEHLFRSHGVAAGPGDAHFWLGGPRRAGHGAFCRSAKAGPCQRRRQVASPAGPAAGPRRGAAVGGAGQQQGCVRGCVGRRCVDLFGTVEHGMVGQRHPERLGRGRLGRSPRGCACSR